MQFIAAIIPKDFIVALFYLWNSSLFIPRNVHLITRVADTFSHLLCPRGHGYLLWLISLLSAQLLQCFFYTFNYTSQDNGKERLCTIINTNSVTRRLDKTQTLSFGKLFDDEEF